MHTYKELGLVPMIGMLKKAYDGGYAVGAYNFVFMEQLLAITDAALAEKSPLILQASANTCRDLGIGFVRHLTAAAVEHAAGKIEIALNLDHGLTFDECNNCIDNGFSSVMIDG